MQNYNVLQAALDKATQKGAFSMDEVNSVVQSLLAIRAKLTQFEKLQEELQVGKKATESEEKEPAKKPTQTGKK